MANLADVINIDLQRSAEEHAFGSSSSSGYKKRVAGTRDWVGTITQKAQGSGPVIADGDSGTATFTEGTGSFAVTLEGPAICTGVTRVLDIDTGAPVEYVYTVAANGAPTTDDTGGTGTAPFSSTNAEFGWA